MSRKELFGKFIGKICFALGRFDNLKRIQAGRVNRLVFVCRGNVCRSPYAEAVARSLGISAVSCGIDVRRSAPAEVNAIQAALLVGKNLSSHMSRSIFDIHLDSSDCLVIMDPSHLHIAREVATRTGCQVTLIGLWLKPISLEIADPYGKPLPAFSKCFDEIDEALNGLLIGLNIRIRF